MSPAAARREADRLDRVFDATGSAPIASRAAALRRHAEQLEAGGCVSELESIAPPISAEVEADEIEAAVSDLEPASEARAAEILGHEAHLPRVAVARPRTCDEEVDAVVARICGFLPPDRTAQPDTADGVVARILAA
ncbi:MAG: hypothetical protein E7773_00755 [Sphingomonas sp.]|uniref:hypothetical protein n=1 Tax=Sphingomonas sp. TaxID=28214 RepID=UPI0011FFD4B2|nr:hypothetical protein [Sphingomonas sp.]THD38316.1 MAG: hypothetical protein E7773_00755 [Sphingomonas sp.]